VDWFSVEEGMKAREMGEVDVNRDYPYYKLTNGCIKGLIGIDCWIYQLERHGIEATLRQALQWLYYTLGSAEQEAK
jgi:hypothetical protein